MSTLFNCTTTSRMTSMSICCLSTLLVALFSTWSLRTVLFHQWQQQECWARSYKELSASIVRISSTRTLNPRISSLMLMARRNWQTLVSQASTTRVLTIRDSVAHQNIYPPKWSTSSVSINHSTSGHSVFYSLKCSLVSLPSRALAEMTCTVTSSVAS